VPSEVEASAAAAWLANRAYGVLGGGITGPQVDNAWPDRHAQAGTLAALEAAALAVEHSRDRFDVAQLTQLAEAPNRISTRVRELCAILTPAPAALPVVVIDESERLVCPACGAADRIAEHETGQRVNELVIEGGTLYANLGDGAFEESPGQNVVCEACHKSVRLPRPVDVYR
jgi:hypothetical protein